MAAVPPKVLVVLSSLCAEGTPVLALDLCKRWIAWGIAPTVMTLANQPDDLRGEFDAAGIPVETVALSSSNATRFAALAAGTYRACRRLRPRAVLSMPLGWHAFTFMGARAAGVRVTAAHVGNYPPAHVPAVLSKFRLLVQLGRPVTDTLICCSSYIQQGVIEHFRVPPAQTRVIYNGVDVAQVARRAAAARDARPADRSTFVVGMVARLEVHKDQPTLIRAAAQLRSAGKRVEVWLIGEGSRRAEYERLIAELGVGDAVKLWGMRRDVPELLGQMDAFVFSAKPDEGLGVALIEAMAAELSIVATDVGACREVLDKPPLGTLVPPGDVSAMAQALSQLSEQSASQRARNLRAKQRATDVFSIDEMAARYAECLKLR